MRTVSLVEAKTHLSGLLAEVEGGEEIIITRHGRAIARVLPPEGPKQPIPLERLLALRQDMPAWSEPSRDILGKLRDAE